jgi:hypothetical protein
MVPAAHSGLGVLILAGSSGRMDADRARVFARHGALAESIRWFGDEGPCEIPIELFQDRVTDLRRSCDRILVVGTSGARPRSRPPGGPPRRTRPHHRNPHGPRRHPGRRPPPGRGRVEPHPVVDARTRAAAMTR